MSRSNGVSVKEMDSIDRLFAEGTPILEALQRAVREAVLRHKKLGNPIATWRDGKVFWIAPEDITVSDPLPDDNPVNGPTDFAF
jgi:hypothetical protein